MKKNSIKRSVLKTVAQMVRVEIEKESKVIQILFVLLFCISLKDQY